MAETRTGSGRAPAGAPRAGAPAQRKPGGSPGARPRRVPQRTCVACRRIEGKRGLVRIVRTPAGTVEVDPGGRQNGRGAYLHADPACWESALKRNALQHALKTELSAEDRARLETFRASLAPVGPDPVGPDPMQPDPVQTRGDEKA